MKTKIHPTNPFSYNRYGFLWEQLVTHPYGVHLDYGAYNGYVIKTLKISGVIASGIGIDLNREIVASSQSDLPKGTQLKHIEKEGPLPFESNYFDSISILDVLEHIYNQDSILQELYRVLKPGGKIIVTVPKQNIFSLLDVGNFKFIFPRLHKWYYQIKYSKNDYNLRYLHNPNGLCGDVEKEKMWHEHFSNKKLLALLQKNSFIETTFDASSLFQRVFIIIALILPFLNTYMIKLSTIDARLFSSSNNFSVSLKPKT